MQLKLYKSSLKKYKNHQHKSKVLVIIHQNYNIRTFFKFVFQRTVNLLRELLLIEYIVIFDLFSDFWNFIKTLLDITKKSSCVQFSVHRIAACDLLKKKMLRKAQMK